MQWGRAGKSKAPPKKDANEKEGTKSPSLTSFWLAGLLGVALVTLLAVAAGYYAWASAENAQRLRQLETCSRILVRGLGERVEALRERVRELGADPQLRKAFRSGGPDALRSQERVSIPLVSGALDVRLLEPGVLLGDDIQSRPLTYAGADLVQQAEQQRRVTPMEVHKLGRPDAYLAVAGPVLDELGETVLGVVYVSIPISLLAAAEGVEAECGRILFQQQVGETFAMVDTERGKLVPDGPPDYQEGVPGTRLRIVAWGIRGGAVDAELLLYAGVAYLVLLALLAAVSWLSLRRLERVLELDYADLVSLVQDAVKRRPAGRLRCRLAETQPVIDALTGLLYGSGAASAGAGGDVGAAPLGGAAEHPEGGGVPPGAMVGATDAREQLGYSVPEEIFRGYDIRGIVESALSPDLARDIGLAVGTEARSAGNQVVMVGRDTRSSGTELSSSLVEGLRASGCDVVDLGVVPTPLLYFATRYQGNTSGVMITASHNPEEYNGFKVVVDGDTIEGVRIKSLRQRILSRDFAQGEGGYQARDLIADYVSRVEEDVAIARPLKLVIECGNGAAAVVAPGLYRELGCDLVELNCDPDGGFAQGGVPDPTRVGYLKTLRQQVVEQGADLGLAFDGDGDRIGIVDSSGKIIWPDRLLMLLAVDVLSRHPGADVVYDVKCSRHLADEILRNGGRPVMWKTGHSPLKAKLKETGAVLAGEWSGHIIFQERWYGFDDALYTGARLLEVLALDPRSSAEAFSDLPEGLGTPELSLPLAEGEAAKIMAAVLEHADHLDGVEVYTIDGLRVESGSGWGLVRASNTQPALVFRFEGDDEAALERAKDMIRELMAQAAPQLALPF